MVKIDNTKIRRGDTVLVRMYYRSWFNDHPVKYTFQEEKVTKITAASVYTEYEGTKTRFRLVKTRPLVAEDFLGGVKTLYRSQEEYDAYVTDKHKERLANSIDNLKANIDMLQSTLSGFERGKLDNDDELLVLNGTIGTAIDKFDKETGYGQ